MTGEMPFSATDRLQLIHSHIAKIPKKPSHVNTNIPKILDEIVLKLMAKTPSKRYQSSFGIAADLKLCQKYVSNNEPIPNFIIAGSDSSSRFEVPQKLFGRDTEIERLLASFEKILLGQNEICLISGHSGIGKSALVHEIHKPIVARRGYFISG